MKNTFSEKLYYRIGEVSKITNTKPHVLRYWESEFKTFNPQKSRSKHRIYRRKDIELIFEIKKLLYEEGYTLEGARRKLRELHKDNMKQMSFNFPDKNILNTLKMLENELKEIKSILE